MDIEKELSGQTEARLVGRLAAAYTLLEQSPYTRSLEFAPGDLAAYVVKEAKKYGELDAVKRSMGL